MISITAVADVPLVLRELVVAILAITEGFLCLPISRTQMEPVPAPTTIGMRRPTVSIVKRDTLALVADPPVMGMEPLMSRCLPAQARVAVPAIGILYTIARSVYLDTQDLVVRLPVMGMEPLMSHHFLPQQVHVAVPETGIRRPTVSIVKRDIQAPIAGILVQMEVLLMSRCFPV